jgi:hypothetical protein
MIISPPILLRMTVTFHETPRTFMIISPPILLRMKNISDEFLYKVKTQVLYLIIFCPENPAVFCEIM